MSTLDPERWKLVEEIFLEVVDLAPPRREEAMAARCGDDRELRAQVESLLAMDGTAAGGEITALVDRAASEVGRRFTLAEGTTIGRYRITGLLGQGGMGEVYDAQQMAPVRRRVALKLVRFGTGDPQVLARFESERQALARMEHPAIATVHDAGVTDDGRPYFVMELVDGTPIDTYCDRRRLDVRSRLELVIEVCRGVQHAHQKGIIHRDLKPSNILVTERDGRALPKVIDFGIAKATVEPLTDSTLLTRAGQVIGTPQYMSPEQADSMGLDVDTRSDVYSLGTVLYELLVGEHPLDLHAPASSSAEECRRQLQETEPTVPSRRVRQTADAREIAERRSTTTHHLARQLAGDLDWVLLKSLEKDRDRRYPSPGELADDLERFLRNEPVMAGPPSRAYRMRKFVRRHRVATLAAAAVATSLVAGIAVAWSGLVRAHSAERDAIQKAAAAQEVSNFLVGLFSASDPNRTQLAGISARQLLDEGAAEIDERLGDQPATKANLLTTIGRVYESVGLSTEARAHLERAVALYDELGGHELELADALNGLATAQRLLGDADGALESARRSLEIRRRVAGENDELVGRSWSAVGTSLIAAGDYEGAEQPLIRARDIAAATVPRSRSHATALYNLAGLYSLLGRPAEAVPLVEQATAISTALDPLSPNLGDMYAGLGSLKHDLGDYEGAERALVRSLEIRRRVYGDDHYLIGQSLANLATLYLSRGQYGEAAATTREAIAASKRAGDDVAAVTVAGHYELLAEASAQLGDFEAARAAARTAIEIRRQLPASHPDAKLGVQSLARVELASGNLDEARRLFEEVLAQRQPLLGEAHPEIVGLYGDLGRLEARAGRQAVAETWYRKVLAGAEKTDSFRSPFVQAPLADYLRLLRATDRGTEAAELEARLEAARAPGRSPPAQ